jgi:hypothetical protein
MVGVTDTYDVLFCAPAPEMYDIYMRLVMEKHAGKNHYGDVHDDGGLPNVNAGCCFGRADVVLRVWESVLNTYDKINSLDDQFTLGHILTHDTEIKSLVVFDSRSELITNVTPAYACTINSVHKINTPILHFAGDPRLSGNMIEFYNHYMRELNQPTYDGVLYQLSYTHVIVASFVLCIIVFIWARGYFRIS